MPGAVLRMAVAPHKGSLVAVVSRSCLQPRGDFCHELIEIDAEWVTASFFPQFPLNLGMLVLNRPRWDLVVITGGNPPCKEATQAANKNAEVPIVQAVTDEQQATVLKMRRQHGRNRGLRRHPR